jgi:hypothetical protein
MILFRHRVAPSRIPGAGLGLFLDESAPRGRVVVAPDAIPVVYRWTEVLAQPDPEAALAASARWFEDCYAITPEWPAECRVNHSFRPNGLWHLGFVFALRDLAPGDEVTIDYRHLFEAGFEESFRDGETGEPIVGFSWEESLRRSTAALAELLAAPAPGA